VLEETWYYSFSKNISSVNLCFLVSYVEALADMGGKLDTTTWQARALSIESDRTT
jgi:hypothetical protein